MIYLRIRIYYSKKDEKSTRRQLNILKISMANFHRYYIKVYIYKIIHSANIDIF